MPSADVTYPQGPMPLTRLNPWMPGQFGVPGAWTETGLRMHCTGAVFYVDPNNTDANDQRDGTDPTAPLATVARALALCQDYRGDVIAIMANSAWQYNDPADTYGTIVQESVIVSTPGVRIVGVSPSGALGVYWTPAAADGTCITVRSCDVVIEGIAFLGNSGGTGIYADYVDYYGDNVTVRHCFFDDTIDEGIILGYSWYGDIHHNFFDGADGAQNLVYGIYSNPVVSTPAYMRIHHNWFQDIGTTAISLQESFRCHIYENTIYNYLAATESVLTPANCMIDLTNGGRNSVHHNTLSCDLPAGVAWDYDACNTAGASDAWIQNYLRDGVSVTEPT